ncbi:MAG TPA: terminase small subunit [Burkholderiales bacterium]
MTRELNDRQLRFVHEYLKDQNAGAAAIRAGYSAKTKGTHAAELMRNPLIRERIDEGLAQLYTALDITAENQLRQLARIAYLDVRRMFDAEGNPLPIAQWPGDLAQTLLVGFDEKRGGDWTRRVRQPARMQALLALERRLAKAGNRRSREEAAEAPEAGERPAGGFFSRLFERRLPHLEEEAAQPPVARGDSATTLSPSVDNRVQAVQPRAGEEVTSEVADAEAPAAANALAEEPAAAYPPGASPFDPTYNFRKDPDWMWGGRYRFKLRREPEALPPEPLERLPANFRVRAGATIPAKESPGFIPPYLHRERPAVAETGPVFDDD